MEPNVDEVVNTHRDNCACGNSFHFHFDGYNNTAKVLTLIALNPDNAHYFSGRYWRTESEER